MTKLCAEAVLKTHKDIYDRWYKARGKDKRNKKTRDPKVNPQFELDLEFGS